MGGLGDVWFFFFSSRRRHTRWTGDWSSDVCSSDLVDRHVTGHPAGTDRGDRVVRHERVDSVEAPAHEVREHPPSEPTLVALRGDEHTAVADRCDSAMAVPAGGPSRGEHRDLVA